MEKAVRIHITGIVQGVGFRPFVYNLAVRHGLRGWCLNDSEGVTIEAEGPEVDEFIDEIRSAPPPLARIKTFRADPIPVNGFKGFVIKESKPIEGVFSLISPDIATCADCVEELFDPGDRRYFYPFTNCTNCGPRYSIVKDIPYDRPKTTMAAFELCDECEREYKDPSDRRFHAQPNACEACGPKVWLYSKDLLKPYESNHSAITLAQKLLKGGSILAIKGLGGFHLVCDAQNEEAVRRLRSKKRRSRHGGPDGDVSNKPFAVMSPDLKAIEGFAHISEDEKKALIGRTRPIVLLRKKSPEALSTFTAPENGRYGVMLPYTPLHHLLFQDAGFKALVMTSGNLSEEPIVIDNDEALRRLYAVADFFLLHDRDIYMRVDDSIARVTGGRLRLIRRARGFTPEPIDLGAELGEVLACGAELKNTFCLTKGSYAILSQHIGDLENLDALDFFNETLRNLKNTFRAAPRAVAHDMHPDYLSTRFAREYAREFGIPQTNIIPVQHHHAHIVSCMAENGKNGKVIGVAFDGTGYGVDGNVWGGEFLTADRTGFERAAHLGYVRLPGGDKAVKEPWRLALSYLFRSYGDERPLKGFYSRVRPADLEIMLKMIRSGLNSPLTSSAGRLFDAVSSLLGLKDFATFEAEAAIRLETIADTEAAGLYEFKISDASPRVIDLRPLIRGIVDDVNSGVAPEVISGRFHNTIAGMIAAVCKMIKAETGINDIALSGGVFQNALLSELTEKRLREEGFDVYTHSVVPANDGGVSLGQAVIAAGTLKGAR